MAMDLATTPSITLKTFNENYLGFFRSLYSKFKSSKELYQHLIKQGKIIKEDRCTEEIHKVFYPQIQLISDALHSEDDSERNCELFDQIDAFKEVNMGDLYNRMSEDDRKVFWDKLKSLCKTTFFAVIKDIEADLRKHIDLKKNPKDMVSDMMSQILSGGSFTKNIIDCIKNKKTRDEMFKAFGEIARTSDGKKTDLSPFSKLIDDEEEDLKELTAESFAEEYKEMMDEMKVNPVDMMSEQMEEIFQSVKAKGGGGNISELLADASSRMKPWMDGSMDYLKKKKEEEEEEKDIVIEEEDTDEEEDVKQSDSDGEADTDAERDEDDDTERDDDEEEEEEEDVDSDLE